MIPASLSEEEIFQTARRLESAEARRGYLDVVCRGDVGLRTEVEALLSAYDASASFLEAPAPEIACDFAIHDETVTERPGTVIGAYTLLQQIGEGGMGVVFKAEQSRPVHRTVALKIIKPGMDTCQVIARFEAERQALAMMDHPNIAKVLDAGTTDTGRPYFAMDLVNGVPITKYCDEKQRSLRDRLELFLPVCHAVQHAHQKGIIHRDIKPTNVLVAEYDHGAVPKIIDFGVAKAVAQKFTERTMFTEIGQVIGTVEYMSPEQAKFSQLDIDTRSDIYSLGVLLYELLTGSTPFARQKPDTVAFDETLRIIREQEPPKPSTKLSTSDTLPSIAADRRTEPATLRNEVRGELDWIVMKALEKDRNRRYETARGLALDVERYLTDQPVQAGPPSARYRFYKFARRNKVWFVAGSIVAVGLLLGTIVSIWQATLARRAKALAETRLQGETEARQQASAISATLQQLLRSADPSEAKGADYTVRQMLDDFSEGLDDKFQDQPATEAAIRAIIGQSYRQLGLTDKAEPHLKAALELRRETLGSDHKMVAQSLIDYAWLLRARGDDVGAEKFARDALAIQKKLAERDADLWLANLHLLQVTLAEQSRYDESEGIAQQALAFARAQPLALAPEASVLRDLAGLALERGQYAKAEQLAREALALHRKLQGENHFATAAGWESLGNAFYYQRQFDEAEKCYRKAVTIFTNSHGYCPITVLTLLAVILDAKGDQAGLNELRPLADAEEVKSGPYGWRKAASRGSLRAKLGDWEKAETYFAESVRLAPDTDAEGCAWADFLLALLRLRADDHAGYRSACTAGINRQSTKSEPAYYFVVWASLIAPDAGVDPGRLVELAEHELQSNPNDPDSFTVYGAALYRAGRWKDAQRALAKAIDAFPLFPKNSHGTVVYVHLFRAMANHRLGQVEQARQSLTTAIEVLKNPSSVSQGDYGGMSWDRRLTSQILRREAERLLFDDHGQQSVDPAPAATNSDQTSRLSPAKDQ